MTTGPDPVGPILWSDPVGHDPRRGRLIVLAGPSGVGKSSVVAGLRAALPELYFSVSATTRDAARGRGRRPRLPVRRPGGLRRADRPRRAARMGRDPRRPAAVRHARAPPSRRRSTPAGPCSWRSTCRAPARSRRRCPSRSPSSSRRRRSTSWSGGCAPAAPRPTPSSPAGSRRRARRWPPAHEFDVVVVNDDLRAVVGRLVDLLVGPGSRGRSAPPFRPVHPRPQEFLSEHAADQRPRRCRSPRASPTRRSTTCSTR